MRGVIFHQRDGLWSEWPYKNKIQIKKYHTVGTITISYIKIIERGKIDIPNTQIHDRSLSLLGTGTPIRGRL